MRLFGTLEAWPVKIHPEMLLAEGVDLACLELDGIV
jgi:hypothetical protein